VNNKIYPENPELEKQARNYLRTLKRRQSYIPAPVKYKAAGGPFSGHDIYFAWGTGNQTAVIRVGEQVGRYKYGGSIARWVPVLVEVGARQ
jgi:hypothetical protein